MPSSAVLGGLLILTSYCLSDCVVEVPKTQWTEPVLVWITIGMPTGSGKTPLFGFLVDLLEQAREARKGPANLSEWVLDEASFEKMGAMMNANSNKLLGI